MKREIPSYFVPSVSLSEFPHYQILLRYFTAFSHCNSPVPRFLYRDYACLAFTCILPAYAPTFSCNSEILSFWILLLSDLSPPFAYDIFPLYQYYWSNIEPNSQFTFCSSWGIKNISQTGADPLSKGEIDSTSYLISIESSKEWSCSNMPQKDEEGRVRNFPGLLEFLKCELSSIFCLRLIPRTCEKIWDSPLSSPFLSSSK